MSIHKLTMTYWDISTYDDRKTELFETERLFATEREAHQFVQQYAEYMGIEQAVISRPVTLRGESIIFWEQVQTFGKMKPKHFLVSQ